MSPTELFADNFTTQLAAPILVSDLTITVAGPAPTTLQASGTFRVLVDSELMVVTAGAAGTVWTVVRGAGTGETPTPTPVPHAAGAVVAQVLTEGGLLNALANAEAIAATASTAAVATETTRATTAEGSLRTLVAAASVPSNSLLQGMAAKPLMGTPPTFGARVTGLNSGTEAAGSTIPGSTAVKPNYAAPRLDTTFRFNGPFNYLSANSGIDCGAFQATTPGGVGPTGMYGTIDYEFVGRIFELRMRDHTATQYLTVWVSKNGGPFLAHTDPDAPMTLLAPGDGGYYLQPVDMLSRASYRIKLEGEALSFGGIRYNGTARTDSGASATSGIPTITDASVVASDAGRIVTGTGIPSGTIVGTVAAGVSFTLVDSAGNPVNTTGVVTGVTLAADTLRAPSWTTSRMLSFTDSYGVGGGGPAVRTDSGATAGSGVSIITDAAILATDVNRPVSGTGIPANSFVGVVTAGVSFTLINGLRAPAVTTGVVTGVTLAAVNQRTAAGYAVKLARSLGLDLHQSGYGGTGISANNIGNGYKFGDPARLAGDVTPFFGPGDQPAVVTLQGSINDGLYGFAALPTQFTTDFDALVSTVQTAYPNAQIYAIHPMHPCRNNATMNTNDATLAGLMDTVMASHGLPVPLDPVSVVPLTGTGSVSAPAGDGNSDQNSAWDKLHPSPAGSLVLATTASTYVKAQALTLARTYTGTPNVPSQLVVASAQSAATAAQAAAAAATVPYIVLRDLGMVELTGLSTGTNYIAIPGAPGSAVTAATAGSARGGIYLDPSYYAVTGKTTKLRLRCFTFANATAPACSFTVALYARSALSGAAAPSVAIGAAVSPSIACTFATPGANSVNGLTSGDVAFPVAAWYLLVVTCDANMAAGSYLELNPILEYHNV